MVESTPHASWHDVLDLFAQASVEPALETVVQAVCVEEPQIHVARSFAVDTSDNEGGTDEQEQAVVMGDEAFDADVRQLKALLPFVRRQSGEEVWSVRRVPSGTRRLTTTSSSSSRDTDLAVDTLLLASVASSLGL